MNYNLYKLTSILFFLTSCIVQSPKYSTLEQVMTLHTGMSKASVEEVLGVKPYDIKAMNDTNDVFIYIYRVTDRKTFYPNTKAVNGKDAIGKYVQLQVSFSKDDKLTCIESCNLCPDNLVTTSSVDFAKVGVFITVTLPIILLYLGLTK